MLTDVCLQAMLDEERKEMVSAARVPKPKNADSYDYARYHPINEVSAPTHGV